MRYIYFGFLVFLSFALNYANCSSLTIQPRFTTSYRFTATDVWNLDLQFSGTKPVQVYLDATITGLGGKSIASIKSINFILNPGVQSFSSTTLGTAQLQYISREIADIESLTGSFPAGNYKVCYFARCVNSDCDGNGADAVYNETPECFELMVEPLTPLLLAFPEDKSEIDTKRPTFNWIPPMPISGVQGFNYMYILVEKRKNQSCPDAMHTNRPLYKQSGIELPVEPYPAELNDLDTGKTYCWKVDGLVGDFPVAQSEVWEFKVKQDTFPIELIHVDQSYLNICDQNGQALYYAIGHLKLKHVVRFGSGTIQFATTDAKGNKVRDGDGNLVVKSGDNRYTIDFEKTGKFKNLQTYFTKLTLPDGKKYDIKFMYVDPVWYNAKINKK